MRPSRVSVTNISAPQQPRREATASVQAQPASPRAAAAGGSYRRRQSGYIFVQALILVTVMVLLIASLAADQRAALQTTQNGLDKRRAEQAADAAVARAFAVLSSGYSTPVNTNAVTQNDDWYKLGTNGDDKFTFADGTTFRMQIVDCGSLINVNTGTAAQTLAQLSNLPLTQEQIDSLLDWRETGTSPRSDGAKDSFYNALAQPYNTKLGPLTTLNELVLIDNWTAQTVYAAPTTTTALPMPTDTAGNPLPLASMLTVDSGAPNTQSSGTARVNFDVRGINTGQLITLGVTRQMATLIGTRAPFTSFQQLLGLPGMNTNTARILLNIATFGTTTRSQGLINLNTASTQVLQTLPSMTNAIASSIVSQQATGFTSLGQLATIAGMTPQILAAVGDSFTVGSDTWLVRSYGESGGAHYALETVVGIRSSLPIVVNREPIASSTLPAWWGWDADSTDTVDAGASQ